MIYSSKLFGRTFGLTKILRKTMITHKFYFGQGGELKFNLTRRKYQINVQTFWEDYSELQIQGLTGVQNFALLENAGICQFKDDQLKDNQNQIISVKLKIPQDYTLNGIINGNFIHKAGQVGNNLRSKPFNLKILGDCHELSMGNIKSEDVTIQNLGGEVNLSGLTVQVGSIEAKRISSKKMMTSKNICLKAQQILIRSLQMFGPSKGFIQAKTLDIESISGDSDIKCDNLKLERYYGGKGNINIQCRSINSKLGIQTGSGVIIFQDQLQVAQNIEKIKLGRMHKGNIEIMQNKVNIY